MFFRKSLSHLISLGSIVLVLSAVSCVLPYPIPADVKHIEITSFPDDAILTLGPRRVLTDVAESVTEADSNIEVIDGVLFRDTAFPEGDWLLRNMLMPNTCNRISEELDVDYLVLVSTKGVLTVEEKDTALPLLVLAFGATEKEMTVNAILLDLKTGESVCQVSSQAHGTERYFMWVVFWAASGPYTWSSASTGLGEELSKIIRGHTASEKVRIAIMAVDRLM
jgi:hypothetical protein